MRVLFLTHRLPYAPNRGDRVRAYHLLRRLQAFADVDLVSLVHDDEEAAHLEESRLLATTVTGVRVPLARNLVRSALALPTAQPLTHVMLDAPDLLPTLDRLSHEHPPDIVFAFCSGIAHVVMHPPLARFPLIVDMVDVDSQKWSALARSSTWPRSAIYAREARTLEHFEIDLTRRAFATLVTTENEQKTLHALVPDGRIDVVQNGVDVVALRPSEPAPPSQTVVFCGVMNYPPNEQGAVWLAHEVWPRVRRSAPAARLVLVGSLPTRTVRKLASESGGITVTGHVPDVRPYLWQAAVAAAPIHTARGVQNKILEAVAAGLPAVITPAVLGGVPPEFQQACTVADGPSAFADEILRLLALTPRARRDLAERAQIAKAAWDERLAGLASLLTAAPKDEAHR